jgi:hypothetical protein
MFCMGALGRTVTFEVVALWVTTSGGPGGINQGLTTELFHSRALEWPGAPNGVFSCPLDPGFLEDLGYCRIPMTVGSPEQWQQSAAYLLNGDSMGNGSSAGSPSCLRTVAAPTKCRVAFTL